jgi:hypothetical protein
MVIFKALPETKTPTLHTVTTAQNIFSSCNMTGFSGQIQVFLKFILYSIPNLVLSGYDYHMIKNILSVSVGVVSSLMAKCWLISIRHAKKCKYLCGISPFWLRIVPQRYRFGFECSTHCLVLVKKQCLVAAAVTTEMQFSAVVCRIT